MTGTRNQRSQRSSARAQRLYEVAVLTALAGAPEGLDGEGLLAALADAGIAIDDAVSAIERAVSSRAIATERGVFVLSGEGARAILAFHGELEAALDPSPTVPGMEECPSIPWLTTVQTHWMDAVSLNYAVDPEKLRSLLPPPLEPEVFRGSAWVQVLASRLREMRPQGTPGLFGVSFHQVSYRAAVRYPSAHGGHRRGGYFVKSETDHPVMRAVGNALVEFRFHEFGLADVSLERRPRDELRFTVRSREPGAAGSGDGGIDVTLDVREGHGAGERSVWPDLASLQAPLVDCCDAFGVDPEGWIYVLTIDREPWRERFAKVKRASVAWLERGPLAPARLDSALFIPEPCAYRWRPLRRERWSPRPR